MKQLLKKLLGNYYQLVRDIIGKYIPTTEFRNRRVTSKMNEERIVQLYSSLLKKDALVFDAGANIGNRVSPLLTIGARVVAVEPQQACVNYLRYKYGKKISIVAKGLAATECIMDFHISHESTLSSFSDGWIEATKSNRFKNASWYKTIKMEMTTLDNLIEQFGTPDFIKIDVEGFETEVLKGLSQPIPLISFEYAVPEKTEDVLKCIELIDRNGGTIECNYSVDESMELKFEQWLSVSQMKQHVRNQEFNKTNNGDVYIRLVESKL